MHARGFHGGLVLAGHKLAAEQPIRVCPIPAELWVPLQQHAGPAGDPCVGIGQRVAAGEPLSIAFDPLSLPVHAPVAAEVIGLREAPLAHAPDRHCLHIGLRPDGRDERFRYPALDWQTADAGALLARLREAGIAGLGGGGFPTADKLASPRPTLILNGAECEPWIACDERLLRERADEVIAGARLLRRLLGAERCVCAVEDSMYAAADALRAARADHDSIDIAMVPTRYPQGGERQLIETLCGREVPMDGRPRDLGIAVVNVATATAAWRAVSQGEALTHRLVSVGGPGVRDNAVFEVALGTPIECLIEAAGGYSDHADRLLIGGPLMGIALPDDSFAIDKRCNSVLVLAAPAQREALPCIRCGDCATVCPMRLQPQQLFGYARAENWDRLQESGALACIECGCCDLACPSHLPLTAEFRRGKAELRMRAEATRAAAAARTRFEQRETRLREAEEERARRRAERAGGAQSNAVQQALQRARERAAQRAAGSGESE